KDAPFEPLLSLHPFLVFRHCEKCSTEQVFVLNTSRENRLTYLSYQCGHQFNLTEYLDEIDSLLAAAGAAPEGSAGAAPAAELADVVACGGPATEEDVVAYGGPVAAAGTLAGLPPPVPVAPPATEPAPRPAPPAEAAAAGRARAGRRAWLGGLIAG